MKSSSRVVLLIFTFALLFLPLVSSYSLISFNDSTKSANFKVGDGWHGGVLKWLQVEENAPITNATINLNSSGIINVSLAFNYSYRKGHGYVPIIVADPYNAIDGNVSTYTDNAAQSFRYNISTVEAKPSNVTITYDTRPLSNSPRLYCYNWSSPTTTTIDHGVLGTGNGIRNASKLMNDDCFKDGYPLGLVLQSSSYLGDSDEVYEIYVNGTYNYLQLEQNQLIYNNASTLNEPQTVDFLGNISSYLSSCTYVSGYCNIPFLFFANGSNNLTFDTLRIHDFAFTENSQTFNTTTTNGAFETMKLNMTFNSSELNANVKLHYNGTNYSATTTDSGDTRTYTANFYVPNASNGYVQDFLWFVDLSDGSLTITFNSTTQSQSIGQFVVDNCSTYTFNLMNVTLYDEDTQAILNGVTDNTSIKIDFTFSTLDDSSSVFNYSTIVNGTNPTRLCLLNNLNQSSYRLDGVIEYGSLNRFSEFYHFQNYTLSNTTADINLKLYDLSNNTGQEFKITYKDANFVPVSNVILDIQRKYVGTGQFLTVERPKTGQEGYTSAYLIPSDVIYNIYVLQEGEVVATFESIIASCQNPTITECEINLNSYGSGGLVDDFTNDNDITFTPISYDTSTRVISTTFVIPSGITADVTLDVTLFDKLGSTVVCNDTVSAVSGSLSCTVPDLFGNTTVIAKLTKDGVQVAQAIILARETPQTLYGDILIMVSIVVFLFFIGYGASSDNPMVMGFSLIFGIVILVALNIVYSPSFFGTGASILWFIIAVIILLIKGGGRQ